MTILHAIILGIIQGVAEFLPISSSGHLVITPYILNWSYQGLDFDIALHLGTIIAVIAYFWSDWIKIIGNAINLDSKSQPDFDKLIRVASDKKQKTEYPHNLFWIIIFASIPAAIAGYFLENLAEHALRNPLLIAIFLAVFALLLWLAESVGNNTTKIKDIGYAKGFIVGVAQAIALFPGVSRSGVTTTAGLFLNLNRSDATKFSFLLATPAILGAFLVSLKNYSAVQIDLAFFIAVATSAIFGFLAIKYLLNFLEKHGFLPFVIYRLAVAAVVIGIYFLR